ncbi:MAG: hypothetical protein IPK31_11535 [Chitinophagaceae bacterium]|nr:hypothetical protein [Chitinophagaceae bacterium]
MKKLSITLFSPFWQFYLHPATVRHSKANKQQLLQAQLKLFSFILNTAALPVY